MIAADMLQMEILQHPLAGNLGTVPIPGRAGTPALSAARKEPRISSKVSKIVSVPPNCPDCLIDIII